MPLNLEKGQKISLNKEAGTSLSTIRMGLGWDTAQGGSSKKGGLLSGLFGGGNSGSGDAIDLDASCLMFDEQGKLLDQVWFVQLLSRDGSIQHSGDNRTGAGEGDDETITVNLNQVPSQVKSLIFTVNSFRGQTFDKVANAFCRLVNAADNQEVARYNLSNQGTHTALIMAKLYRHNGEWKMHAIGEPSHGTTFDKMMPQIAPHVT